MRMTRRKEDFNAITYEIFKSGGINVKFKVKLYNENTVNQTTQSEYYHKEYVFNGYNKSRQATISLSAKGYIQIDVYQGDDPKYMFFMGEVMKNKIVRKLTKFIALLEAYDDKEIDIITVDSSGTHINSKFPKSEKIILGKSEMKVLACIREEKCDVGIAIQFDDAKPVILPLFLFVELYYRLKDINFTQCTMALLNYIGSPELGQHETDFRQEGIFDKSYQSIPEPRQKYEGKPMSELSEIADKNTLKNTKNISW